MDNKEIISQIIKEEEKGTTIQEIVNKTKLSWNTVTKILASLSGEGRISVREVGQAKLHYWKNKNE